jgi:hypothetical protein
MAFPRSGVFVDKPYKAICLQRPQTPDDAGIKPLQFALTSFLRGLIRDDTVNSPWVLTVSSVYA